MKKLLTIAVLVGATTVSFAQGTLLWNNTASTLISVNGEAMPANNPVSPETTYYFGLFIAPIGTTTSLGITDPNWQFVGAYAQNSTAAAGAGRFQNPGTATIAGYAPGTSVNFLVRGWHASLGGQDWNAARTALQNGTVAGFGESEIGFIVLGGGPIPNNSIWGTTDSETLKQIGGFNIVVPEPSSMALAGLGAASLLIFRRRK